MKLDADLELQILEKVGIYSNRFSIEEPKILLTTKAVLDSPKEQTEGRRTSAYKYYGVCYYQHNLVFINVRKTPDEKVRLKEPLGIPPPWATTYAMGSATTPGVLSSPLQVGG